MSRPMCWRCRWPLDLCWCSRIDPMQTRTRFVILMHPKEARHTKANTGRFTHLSLVNSSLPVGVDFSSHPEVRAILDDPAWLPVLLYPSPEPLMIRPGTVLDTTRPGPGSKTLCVFVLDATWHCAKTMYKVNPWLHSLPHIGISPETPSLYRIKKQPGEHCLSTLEAVHQVLLDLESCALDTYPRPQMMLDLFRAMQEHQEACALPSGQPGHSGHPRRTEGARLPRQPRNPA